MASHGFLWALRNHTLQYGAIMNANYTCAGTGEVESYTTMFSYYGFRYVQVRTSRDLVITI